MLLISLNYLFLTTFLSNIYQSEEEKVVVVVPSKRVHKQWGEVMIDYCRVAKKKKKDK